MAKRLSREGSDSWDVIVVGAGGCGLVAALAAAQRGARVLVLEKTDAPGGTTALSHGGITAAGSRFQRRQGVEDDPETLVKEIVHRSGSKKEIVLAQRLAHASAAAVEWLADTTGVEFELSTQRAGHSIPRSHTWGNGRALVDRLLNAVERHENIRVLCSTPVVSLETDATGAVIGVRTERELLRAGKVILATGGYGASHEMLSKYIPKAAGLPYGGHHGSTGDGLRMGLSAGSDTANLGAFQPYPSYHTPLRIPIPQDVLHMGGIQVDQHGRRFVDETLFPGVLGAKMLDLPGRCAYEVFDERIFHSASDRLAQVVQAGFLVKAATSDELARNLGIDADGLTGTIQRLNEGAGRVRDKFGRSVATPLGVPLYGAKVWVAMYHTQGGLGVNTDAQALRSDGSAIPNLYAGGGAAAGISGTGPEGYFPGNGLLTVIGLGKLAGEHAASALRR
jgi:fumarate reductase flavoprotein subunit